MRLNENYRNLKQNYLFAETAHRTNAYIQAHPEKSVIRLGIGDVTLPLAASVVFTVGGPGSSAQSRS